MSSTRRGIDGKTHGKTIIRGYAGSLRRLLVYIYGGCVTGIYYMYIQFKQYSIYFPALVSVLVILANHMIIIYKDVRIWMTKVLN